MHESKKMYSQKKPPVPNVDNKLSELGLSVVDKKQLDSFKQLPAPENKILVF